MKNDKLKFPLTIPHVDLDKYSINKSVVTVIPENIARRYGLIAIDKKDKFLIVAMADPLNIFALDDIKFSVKMKIQPVASENEKITRIIDKYYSGKYTKKVLEEFVGTFDPVDKSDIYDVEQLEVATSPIVKLLNSIIEQAVRDRASDIHIEPYQENIRIRFRIDGDLKEIMTLSKNSLSGIITRIKIMSKMNIAEKRVAQDGRVELNIDGRYIDMRISTLPTVYGEKTVIRLLDKTNFNFTKKSLGFSERDLYIFDKILSQPCGMLLLTGPAGSGTVLR